MGDDVVNSYMTDMWGCEFTDTQLRAGTFSELEAALTSGGHAEYVARMEPQYYTGHTGCTTLERHRCCPVQNHSKAIGHTMKVLAATLFDVPLGGFV